MEELSQKVYRALGVARSTVGDLENLQFVGLVSLADPPAAGLQKYDRWYQGTGNKTVNADRGQHRHR